VEIADGLVCFLVRNRIGLKQMLPARSVQDRDLGAVSRDVQRIVDADRKSLPRGTFITIRGQVETMRSSYLGLIIGLGFAIVLVYMLKLMISGGCVAGGRSRRMKPDAATTCEFARSTLAPG
jgi:hypothetical protein